MSNIYLTKYSTRTRLVIGCGDILSNYRTDMIYFRFTDLSCRVSSPLRYSELAHEDTVRQKRNSLDRRCASRARIPFTAIVDCDNSGDGELASQLRSKGTLAEKKRFGNVQLRTHTCSDTEATWFSFYVDRDRKSMVPAI